jgi:hypothetical protein
MDSVIVYKNSTVCSASVHLPEPANPAVSHGEPKAPAGFEKTSG